MKTEKELLNKFIEMEVEKCRGGSGDDEFYVQHLENYIKEQNLLWMDFIKFIKKQRNAEVKQAINKLQLECPIQEGKKCWCKPLEKLLQKLGLEKKKK